MPMNEEPGISSLMLRLGRLEYTSDRLRGTMSSAMIDGAYNLLDKALRALEARDVERAERFVTRAASMPWDDHEEDFPGLMAGIIMVSREVNDALDESSDDDETWLDVALEVLKESNGPGHDQLAATLRLFAAYAEDFDLSPHEERRIRSAVGSSSQDVVHHSGPDTPLDTRIEVLGSLLAMATLYHVRYFHRPALDAP